MGNVSRKKQTRTLAIVLLVVLAAIALLIWQGSLDAQTAKFKGLFMPSETTSTSSSVGLPAAPVEKKPVLEEAEVF